MFPQWKRHSRPPNLRLAHTSIDDLPADELLRLSFLDRFDETGHNNPVVPPHQWPRDRASERVLFETLEDLVDIGVNGALHPVALVSTLPDGSPGTYSVTRVTSPRGISVRTRRLNDPSRPGRQFGFIDEDGHERHAGSIEEAKDVYTSMCIGISQNPDDSAKSGELVLAPGSDTELCGLAHAFNSLATAGITGTVTLVEDVEDCNWSGYRRTHTTVQVEDRQGRTVFFREEHVDYEVVRHAFWYENNRAWWDENHPYLLSGFSSDREMTRTMMAAVVPAMARA